MILNNHFDVDAEIAAARERIAKAIARVVHFQARSAGQQARRQREKGKQ